MSIVNYKSIPTYTVNLDNPAHLRWTEIINAYKPEILNVLSKMEYFFQSKTTKFLAESVFSIISYFDYIMYNDEIKAIAEQLGVSTGKIAMLQLCYEYFSCCTSVIRNKNESVYHFRTMDWDLPILSTITINVNFVNNNNHIIAKTTTWAGYVGILTGMVPRSFAVSINYRRSDESFQSFWYNIYYAYYSAYPIGFLTRHILTNKTSYADALQMFQNTDLISPCYIILSGNYCNQGCILTRDRTKSLKKITLSDNVEYLVQTNMDHWRDLNECDQWQNIEFSYQRRSFCYYKLANLPEELMDPDALFNILREKPLNAYDTIYRTGMIARDDYYYSELK